MNYNLNDEWIKVEVITSREKITEELVEEIKNQQKIRFNDANLNYKIEIIENIIDTYTNRFNKVKKISYDVVLYIKKEDLSEYKEYKQKNNLDEPWELKTTHEEDIEFEQKLYNSRKKELDIINYITIISFFIYVVVLCYIIYRLKDNLKENIIGIVIMVLINIFIIQALLRKIFENKKEKNNEYRS